MGASSECALAVTPTPSRLRVGGTQTFTTPIGYVTWSVDEKGGGSIDQHGVYRAPLRPGSYHVRAHAPNGASATGMVQVGPVQLTRQLGLPGGFGTADGTGPDARFTLPTSVVADGEYLYVSDGPRQHPCVNGCGGAEKPSKCIRESCKIALSSIGLRRISITSQTVEHVSNDRLLRHIVLDGGRLFAVTGEPQISCGFGSCEARWSSFQEVVEVDLTTGVTHVLAGASESGAPQDGPGGSARFLSIAAMAADGAGSLFLIDAFGGDAALRKVVAKSGTVTTLVATSNWPGTSIAHAPFNSLKALAYRYGSLYLLDDQALSQTLWRYHVSSGSLTEYKKYEKGGGGLSAVRFCGNKLIGSVGKCVGAVTTPNPTCNSPVLSAGLGPDGLGCDLEGNMYVTDSAAGIVLHSKYSILGGPGVGPHDSVWKTLAGEPAHPGPDFPGPTMRLTAPTAVTSDAAGNLAVYNNDMTLIHLGSLGAFTAHDASSANVKIWGPFPAIALGSNGRLFFEGQWAEIAWLDLISGERSALGFAGADIVALAHDGLNSVYVAACADGNNQIKQVDDKTGATTVVTKDGPCGLLAADGAKRLFAAGGKQLSGGLAPPTFGSISSIDLGTHIATPLPTPPDGWQATALAYDPAGLLYVAEAHRSRVRGLVVETGEVFDVVGKLGSQGVQLGPLPASLNTPSGIALRPDGSLAITDYAENVLLVAQ